MTTKQISGTIGRAGVEWFLFADDGEYKIDFSERERLVIEPGMKATGEVDLNIHPPEEAIGWVKIGTLRIVKPNPLEHQNRYSFSTLHAPSRPFLGRTHTYLND